MRDIVVSGGQLRTLVLLRQMELEATSGITMNFIAEVHGVCRRSARRYVKNLKSLGLITVSRPSLGLPYSFRLTNEGLNTLDRSQIDRTSKFRKLDSCPF
jgi:predicted ArsR family transcriptional regulator